MKSIQDEKATSRLTELHDQMPNSSQESKTQPIRQLGAKIKTEFHLRC